jgi:hypothetical protein
MDADIGVELGICSPPQFRIISKLKGRKYTKQQHEELNKLKYTILRRYVKLILNDLHGILKEDKMGRECSTHREDFRGKVRTRKT